MDVFSLDQTVRYTRGGGDKSILGKIIDVFVSTNEDDEINYIVQDESGAKYTAYTSELKAIEPETKNGLSAYESREALVTEAHRIADASERMATSLELIVHHLAMMETETLQRIAGVLERREETEVTATLESTDANYTAVSFSASDPEAVKAFARKFGLDNGQ